MVERHRRAPRRLAGALWLRRRRDRRRPRALLARQPGERRLVFTKTGTGCYVVDRRSGERALQAARLSDAPSRHELDDLVSITCAAALESELLLVCNPFPADALPTEAYATLVADVRGNGTRVVVDLSSPRLDAALEGRPDVVKLNDWELAEYVRGRVDGPACAQPPSGCWRPGRDR